IEEEVGNLSANPARDVARLRPKRLGGHHSWTPEEVNQFEQRHPLGTKAHLALSLLIYTGVRRSDVVALGRQHVRAGWLKFTAHKNRNKKPVTIEIPVLPILAEIIAASPTGDLNFLETDYGQPFTANGFGGKFKQWCREAGLPHCSAHGL